VDLWKNTSKTVSKTANVTIPKGKHTLRIDYANWTGAAKVKFTRWRARRRPHRPAAVCPR
ncbi:hypothetical protein, partial [Streptomyces sp. Agncl-13]|uniref:hypothetical protein n=1 Tax=Streptomyces sp. Agncl-13 TaxID=3400628 RepID=UPI003A8790FD